MALTDTFVRSVKADTRPRKYSDAGGLFLYVPTSGSKLWRLAYGFGGKQRTLAIGAYPAVSLAAARKARDAAKEKLAQGIDPGREKRLEKIRTADAAKNTFSAVAADLRAKLVAEGKAARTLVKFDALIGLAEQDLGGLPVSEISAAEVLAVAKKLEGRGKLAYAAKQRQMIGQVFRYAVATGRAANDPTIALRGALASRPVIHRPAIRDRKAFGGLLRAVWSYPHKETAAGLKLLALIYCRPGELRLAEWREFDFDEATWTIPASRMKGRREHRKPLPPQAIEVLREQRAISGDGDLVFPSARSRRRPISDMCWGAALRYMGIGQGDHCPHGFRASGATMLNESGLWSSDAVERELAHVDDNSIRRAYARGDRWDERVKMAAWWADQIGGMRDGAEIVALCA